MTIRQIEKELLKLDTRSRAKLAERVLHSLDDLSEAENEMLWAQEALRRHKELIADPSKGRPAEEVFQEARAKLYDRNKIRYIMSDEI